MYSVVQTSKFSFYLCRHYNVVYIRIKICHIALGTKYFVQFKAIIYLKIILLPEILLWFLLDVMLFQTRMTDFLKEMCEEINGTP